MFKLNTAPQEWSVKDKEEEEEVDDEEEDDEEK